MNVEEVILLSWLHKIFVVKVGGKKSGINLNVPKVKTEFSAFQNA